MGKRLTSIQLDEDIFEHAKEKAERNMISFQGAVEQLLKLWILGEVTVKSTADMTVDDIALKSGINVKQK